MTKRKLFHYRKCILQHDENGKFSASLAFYDDKEPCCVDKLIPPTEWSEELTELLNVKDGSTAYPLNLYCVIFHGFSFTAVEMTYKEELLCSHKSILYSTLSSIALVKSLSGFARTKLQTTLKITFSQNRQMLMMLTLQLLFFFSRID